MSNLLEEFLKPLQLDPKLTEQLYKDRAEPIVKGLRWFPTVGPQYDAYYSDADELFYGGQAGGGKTDLIIGLSLTGHQRSLVLRRTNKEASKLFDRYLEVVGNRDGWNGQKNTWHMPDGRVIDIGGCQLESDKQNYKGNPHDLISFDEVGDFAESQYTFLIAWNRSVVPGQRCRVLAAGNPPTNPEGLWVLRRWAPWIDPTHPKPAKEGELRWFTTGKDANGMDLEIEVNGRGPHLINGEMVEAKSRTFIRARLSDNPFQDTADYRATLAALPPELRAAYRDGRFDLSLKDQDRQCIPTLWLRQAQDRWTSSPPEGVPMCAIGVDVARGGDDQTVLAPRHDGWYAPLVAIPGAKTPTGPDVAGLVLTHRRDGATVIIDMGGGYGGSPYDHLKQNDIDVVAYRGMEASHARTNDRTMRFTNKRTEAYWRFREALDPGQPGGSPIMLPPDQELVSDLAAPLYETTPNGYKLETKQHLVERLGRSPDKGDAVVMAWSTGERTATSWHTWQQKNSPPKIIMGRDAQRRPRS